MMRGVAALTLLTLACLPALAADKPTRGIGHKFPKVELTDLDGKVVSLDKVQGQKATVVVFLSFECPISNSYIPGLNDLATAQAKEGVHVVGVCESDEPVAQVRKWITEYKITFPIYVDAKQITAHGLHAETTPEAFVLDAGLTLRYRGRIDDSYNERFQRNARVTSPDVKDAVAAILAGKEIKTTSTKAVGCPIPQPEKPPTSDKMTYYRDVAPILQKHCQVCHRPGEVGPFALETYKQAKRWAKDIKTYTASKTMPPWMPTAGPVFRNERKLTAQEITTLAVWADAGAPEGEVKDAPKPIEWKDGWPNGKPDLVLTPREAFHLGAEGKDIFRCFIIPIETSDHQWVIGYDVKPGAARVVHHTLHFFDGTGNGRKLELAEQGKKVAPGVKDRGPGYPVAMGVGFSPPPYKLGELPKFGGVGGWAPGQAPQFLPDGAGIFLPKGSDFILQVHYHRDGKPAEDRTQVGLYFATKPIDQPWQTVIIEGMKSDEVILPNEKKHVSKGVTYLHTEALLHNVMPHMHLLGKSIKVTLTPPNGKPQTLISIAEWDYRWQDTYWFKEPILAPVGSKLEVEGVFDNSVDNPNNPSSPPKRVGRGEETTDEMLFAFLGATSTKKPWQIVRFQRTPPVLAPKEPLKEPAPETPMQILERRLGTWNSEITINEAALTPQASTAKAVETVTKELNGKIIQSKSKSDASETLMLTTWDASRKEYRSWYYDSDGIINEASGQYDAGTKTLTWTNPPVEGVSTTVIWKFISDDQFAWELLSKDADGKRFLDMKGKLTRKK